MKAILILAMIMSSLQGISQSQPEQEVAAAVEELRKAMVNPDKAALEKLTSVKLSYGHSSGKIEDRDAFINALLTGESDFVDITLSDQTITLVDDVAIVRHKFFANTNDKGKGPGKANIGIMLVWKKTEGKWLLLGRQAFRL